MKLECYVSIIRVCISAYVPRLRVFLHYRGHSLDQLTCGDWLLVNQVVLLCQFPSSSHQNPVSMKVHFRYPCGPYGKDKLQKDPTPPLQRKIKDVFPP